MKRIKINGGKRLHGDVPISGMKNAALPIIFATILVSGDCRLDNIPEISDVHNCLAILKSMGARVEKLEEGSYLINTCGLSVEAPPRELVDKVRASYYLMGAELGRFGRMKVGYPGGCNFGNKRPIDQHIKGFRMLGATITESPDLIEGEAGDGLHSANIFFDLVTVGGTVNLMLAAVLTPGTTVIDNAAREPHIVDLANFLNTCGADIRGAGTDTIRINGTESLGGCSYTIIPDMIEAGTYMAVAAATGGCICIKNVIPRHLESTSAKLEEMGIDVNESGDSIVVNAVNKPILPVNIKTQPYPGFPTDMQAQFGALLSIAGGDGRIIENIYDKRFKYADELSRMGANIEVSDKSALFHGVPRLCGANVRATDLRAGGAVIIAALSAEGTTIIDDIHIIERGYVDIVGKLKALGADIEYTED